MWERSRVGSSPIRRIRKEAASIEKSVFAAFLFYPETSFQNKKSIQNRFLSSSNHLNSILLLISNTGVACQSVIR